jgi:hypothetical protein
MNSLANIFVANAIKVTYIKFNAILLRLQQKNKGAV